MRKFSSIQKLDILLKVINEIIKPNNTGLGIRHALFKLNYTEDEIVSDLKILIEKLIEDGFIKPEPLFTFDNTFKEKEEKGYILTVKGHLHLDTNGYQGRDQARIADNIRLENLEKAQKDYQCRTILLTAILAFGTSIAAWYYFLEICKIYHWFCF